MENFLEKRLSQKGLGQIKRGYAYDPAIGKFPVAQTIINAAAIGTTDVHAAIAVTTAEQTITTAITDPDVLRTLNITGVGAGVNSIVTIYGTDWAGRQVSDSITGAGATTVEGVVAFATVDRIVVAAKAVPAGETISVGYGASLGLKRPIAATADIHLLVAGAFVAEAVAAASVAHNTFTPTTALDGATDFTVFYDTYLI